MLAWSLHSGGGSESSRPCHPLGFRVVLTSQDRLRGETKALCDIKSKQLFWLETRSCFGRVAYRLGIQDLHLS